ncbi:unnamed protein product, partial [Ectocarpus sp. 12 AP-2014]
MNPNITPDNLHTATRLYHRFKNSHCCCGKTNSRDGSNISNRINALTVKTGTTEAVFGKHSKLRSLRKLKNMVRTQSGERRAASRGCRW